MYVGKQQAVSGEWETLPLSLHLPVTLPLSLPLLLMKVINLELLLADLAHV